MAKKDKTAHQKVTMNPYEMDKMRRMESNAAVMKAKGFSNNFVNKVLLEKYTKVSSDQQDASFLEEEDADCQLEVQEVNKKINCSRSMKGKSGLNQKLPMEELLHLKREQCGKPGQEPCQQSHRILNLQKDKTNFCAPGSMAKNATMKKMQALRGQRSINEVHLNNATEADSSEDIPGTTTRYENMRKNQVLRGCPHNDMNDMHQQSRDGDDFPEGAENNQNEDDENNQNEEANALVLNTGNENAPGTSTCSFFRELKFKL